MLDFAFGFLAFPVLAVIALLALAKVTEPPKVDVRANDAAMEMLRRLLSKTKAGSTLFVSWPKLGLILRISNRVRKSTPNTLSVELRNSDSNREFYVPIRESLADAGIEFDEKLTPARRVPKLLRISWPEGGPLVVSAVVHVLDVVESALPNGSSEERVGSMLDPVLRRARRGDAA